MQGRVDSLDIILYVAQRLPKISGIAASTARDVIINVVAEMAQDDFEIAELILQWPIDEILDPGEALFEATRRVRKMETSCRTTEGVKVPPLQLAACESDKRALERAVWRAQTRVMFPLIEQRRSTLVAAAPTWLTLPFKRDGGATITDAFDLEIGHLLELLRTRRPRDPLVEELRTLRKIRNELAHLRPCPPKWLRQPAIRQLIDFSAFRLA